MWENFYINKNQIQTETNRSILVKLPKSDWLVWISNKCIRKGTHSANLCIGVMKEGKYELFKNGKGKHNRFTKIESKTVLGEELALMCGVEAPIKKDDEYHIPQHIEPNFNQKADDDLLA